jgi:sec-independent protein translocase protein TatC
VVNQLLMAVPLMILYEISVVAVWAFGRKGFSGFRKEDADEKKKHMDIKE